MARAKRKQHHSTHHSAGGRHSTHNHNDNRDNGRRGSERMISAGREQLGRMQRNSRSAFDMFRGPMARMLDYNFSLFQKTVQTMQEESLHFFNQRLEHTTRAIESSRDFQGVSGLMQLQQEWMLELAHDCSEHATRFAQMMRDLATESTERLVEVSSEAMERSEEELEDEEDAYEGDGKEHQAAA